MSVLNTSTRNAIVNAIHAKRDLDKAMSIVFTQHNTNTGRRDTLWEASAIVAETYGELYGEVIEAYSSRKGDSIAFGAVLTDDTRDRTKGSKAAAAWFSRNIVNAGIITIIKPESNRIDRKGAMQKAATAMANKWTAREIEAIAALAVAARASKK